MYDREAVPCGLCGKSTIYTGTKRCNRCWELERRVSEDPALARKILETLGPYWIVSQSQEVIWLRF